MQIKIGVRLTQGGSVHDFTCYNYRGEYVFNSLLKTGENHSIVFATLDGMSCWETTQNELATMSVAESMSFQSVMIQWYHRAVEHYSRLAKYRLN